MGFKRIIGFCIIYIFIGLSPLRSQFLWAEVGVDGLTCSACSRSVEMSLLKLNFVDSVVMNLEHTDGKIYFKKSAKIEMDKIAQAVVNAGFSVRFLKADFFFKDLPVSDNSKFTNDDCTYQFIKIPAKTLNGETIITFIGKKFLSKKEFSHWKTEMKNTSSDKKEKIYFVTL